MVKRLWAMRPLLGLILALSLGLQTQPLLAAPLVHPGAQAPLPAGSTVHVVQAGETLSAIAARYGVTTAALAQANQLQNPDRLAIGQRLVIPARPAAADVLRPQLRYIVQPGESWDSLARKFRIAKNLLKQANPLISKTILRPGESIDVPQALNLSALGVHRFAVTPAQPQQGEAAALALTADRPLTITAHYAGSDLTVVQAGQGGWWALFGVHPLATPGVTWLEMDVQGLDLPAALRAEPDDPVLHGRWPVLVLAGSFEVQHLVLPADKGNLLDPKLVADERVKLDTTWWQHELQPQWTGVFTLPLSSAFQVTSPFGTRRSYNGGPVASFHEGQDFSAAAGSVVSAPAPGIVVLAEPLAVRGNAVILDHGAGLHTGYWHLSKIDVKVGQRVETGDKLGEVGTTGLSTGAHLHWEMRVGATPVDPLTWLQRVLP